MLDYHWIDVSEGIDTNKTYGLCESIICYYRYFLDKNFRFDPKVCNGFHHYMPKTMNSNYAAIISAKKKYKYGQRKHNMW